MNLGENLLKYRKEHGLSQEELAEQLQVSRQSIYKWESGQSFPEVEKLILMSELLNCSMDELVKGEVNIANINLKQSFIDHYYLFARAMASGVMLVLLGVAVMMVLMEYLNSTTLPLVAMFSLLLIAVFLFINFGIGHAQFIEEYRNSIETPLFTPKEQKGFMKRFRLSITMGVVLSLVSVVAVIVLQSLIGDESLWPAATMLSIIAIASFLFVNNGILYELYFSNKVIKKSPDINNPNVKRLISGNKFSC